MAADKLHGETLTFRSFESEAHSLVLVSLDTTSTYVGVADLDSGGLASAMEHRQARRRENNTLTPGPSRSRGFRNPTLAVGTTVNGSIEAKTDSAYMMTVIVAGEKLTGMLYHVCPKSEVKQFARVMAPLLEIHAADIKSGSLRRRRRILRCKDRNAPKKNRTGYNFFFAQERVRLKEAYPNMRSEREISQTIADAWNGLSQKQREPYQELGVRDGQRYRAEMGEYVHQRQCKMKALDLGGHTNAEGGVSPVEDQPTPFTVLNTLALIKVHEIDGAVPTEEQGSSSMS